MFSIEVQAHGNVKVIGVEHEEGFIDLKIYLDRDTFLKAQQSLDERKPAYGFSIVHKKNWSIPKSKHKRKKYKEYIKRKE